MHTKTRSKPKGALETMKENLREMQFEQMKCVDIYDIVIPARRQHYQKLMVQIKALRTSIVQLQGYGE